MQNKSAIPVILGYFYIVLPIIIFFIGWCNIYTSVFGVILILSGLFFAIKNAPKIWVPENKKQILLLLGILVITVIWVYLSGIGALVFQNSDHYEKNAIFEILVKQSWPVISPVQPIMLTYYIGFWLPSVVVAKIFNSIQIGYYFQIIWAILGIFLFFYYVLSSLKNKNLFPILLFIFFSGMDILGVLITWQTKLFPIVAHIEPWFPKYQFSSMTTQLFWVFNQAIPAWIITMLLFQEKTNKNLIFIYSCMFLSSTIPAIGIFPFLAFFYFKNMKEEINQKISLNVLKQYFIKSLTFQNFAALCITLVSYLYLSNNMSGQVIENTKPYLTEIFLVCFCFFMVEAGMYLFCIWKDFKKEILYYIIFLCLLIYPFIVIGSSADFCMRATIPALVFLYLLIAKLFDNVDLKSLKFRHYFLIICLFIGTITPIHEFSRTIVGTMHNFIKRQPKLVGENFFAPTENNQFLKYFGKFKK